MASSLKLAREMIAYQTDGFKARLISEVGDMMRCYSANAAQKSTALANIEKLVHQRTGVFLKLYVNYYNDPDLDAPSGWPVIDPEFLNNCHVLRPDEHTGGYSPGIIRTMLRQKGSFRGEVDYKNAKLKGDYTKIEFPVHFSFEIMDHFSLTASQVAGMIMHEVGHAWTIMATSWATARASYFLAGIRDSFTRKEQTDNVQHIITELGEVLAKENLIQGELNIDTKDYATICTMVYTEVFRKVSSDIGTRASSAHQAESLADVFATRFGFGEDLASVIKGFQDPKANYYINAAVGALIVGGICVLAAPLGIAAGVVTSAAVIHFSGHTSDGTKTKEIYGTDKDRVNRIRLSVIDALKSDKLKGAVRKDLLEQERSLSSLLRNMKDGGDLLDDIANFIYPSRRATVAAIQLEKDLESLMANDLFVSGQALRAAASS